VVDKKVPPKKEKPKKRKKRKAFGNNKKMQSLAAKWAKVELQEKIEAAKHTPAAKAARERKLNEKWVMEQSGNTAEDNPNLIKVPDWRKRMGIKKKEQ